MGFRAFFPPQFLLKEPAGPPIGHALKNPSLAPMLTVLNKTISFGCNPASSAFLALMVLWFLLSDGSSSVSYHLGCQLTIA